MWAEYLYKHALRPQTDRDDPYGRWLVFELLQAGFTWEIMVTQEEVMDDWVELVAEKGPQGKKRQAQDQEQEQEHSGMLGDPEGADPFAESSSAPKRRKRG